jgi:putative pyruvate formate lyase activating enzyme
LEFMSIADYSSCMLCPRECGIDRNVYYGYCRSSAKLSVALVCTHHGEEPVISGLKGICNVFFHHCNLACIYCQNYQISDNKVIAKESDISEIIDTICQILDNGIKSIGFVSPTHYLPHLKNIIKKVKARGYKPIFVYNTNGYEKVEELKKLEGYIDVYLPDFKYIITHEAIEFSDVPNYPEKAIAAIKEMYYQKGSVLHLSDDGIAESGLIIRHLILPGHTDSSIQLFRSIAEEISTNIHISLMSQYWVSREMQNHALLGKKLHKWEYEKVKTEVLKMGFQKGWFQDLESSGFYAPNFDNHDPFDK